MTTTATVPWNSSQEGQRLTVNLMVKQPAIVRARMLSMLAQQFITDALLRPGPPAPGGSVLYYESTPLFADDDAAIVEEFGEIPATVGEMGRPMVVRTIKRALALLISEEMRRRDDVGAVDKQITQIRNTIVRAWERVFLNAILTNPGVHTLGATTAWSSSVSKIRYDLAQGMFLVENSDSDSTDNTGQNKFQFNPDTLVISTKTSSDFLASDDIQKVFAGGDLASESLQYTGKMPKKFFGLDVVKSWQLPADKAIVLERRTVGGISDERPLTVGRMVESEKDETWWMKTLRQSAVFIDQPKAACVLTGV